MTSRIVLGALIFVLAIQGIVTPLFGSSTQVAEAAPAEQFNPGCPIGQWHVEYWGNMNLSGTPTVPTDPCLAGPLDKTWAEGVQPYPGIGPNYWSARFVSNQYIAGGNQTFTATYDDSVRVAVDSSSQWAIEDWVNGAQRTTSVVKTVNPNAANNVHTVWVEFKQNGYGSRLKVDWTGANPPTATPTSTATATSTSTSTPTNTPVPPTDTPVPPTNTPVPPTDTPVPPTATSTNTPVPPTNTPIPPTATATIAPLTDLKCPQSVEDLYKKVGPNGKLYPGWHPQQDAAYGCFFEHEHGNGGALLANAHRSDGTPFEIVYGYAADEAGIAEGHFGHKTYIVGPGNGWGDYQWVMSHHFGTTSINRFCQFEHELDVAIIRASDGLVMGEFYGVVPHGHAVNAQNEIYRPAECPNQHEDYLAKYTSKAIQGIVYFGQRLINFLTGADYEPWSGFYHPNFTGVTPAFPDGRFDFAVNTAGINLKCDDVNCTVRGTHETDGTARFLDLGGYGFKRGGAAANTGDFCTDYIGFQIISCSVAGAIKQHAELNWNAPKRVPEGLDEECYYSNSQVINGTRVYGEYLPMVCGRDPLNFPLDYNRTDSHGVKRVKMPN